MIYVRFTLALKISKDTRASILKNKIGFKDKSKKDIMHVLLTLNVYL